MQDVPTLDVVSPPGPHSLVALKYDPSSMAAPMVGGQGRLGELAFKIMEIARDQGRKILRHPPPLARGGCITTDDIAFRNYQTACTWPSAQVLAYVFQLRSVPQGPRRTSPTMSGISHYRRLATRHFDEKRKFYCVILKP